MLIQLDDNYRIEADSYNFVLRYESKDGKEYKAKNGEVKKGTSKDEWFFPNISMLLKRYVDLTMNDDDAKDIKDLLIRIEETKQTIEKFFNNGTRL